MKADDPGAYEVNNRAFHAAIHNGSGNEILEETAQSVRARLVPFRSAQFHIPGRVAKSISEHSNVVAAILNGDDEKPMKRCAHTC